MSILIIDQCSGSKNTTDDAPEFDAATIDEYGRETLIARDDVPAIPARDLYTGRQQKRIDEAVDTLRAAGETVDRKYVSAGFGLVDEETPLPPYEVTFSDMNAAEIDERAATLSIPAAVREAVQAEPAYDMVVLALGKDYCRACDLSAVLEALPNETTGVLFNQEKLAAENNNVVSISARASEAKEHGTIVIALKGTYLKHFAAHRSNGTEAGSTDEVAELFNTDPTAHQNQ